MTNKLLILSLFLSLTLPVSTSIIAETSNQNVSETAQTVQTKAETKNGQILEALTIINTNEINAAKEALARSSNPDVKNFAQAMMNDHSKNLAAVKSLSQKTNIQPVSSEKTDLLQKQGQTELNKLKAVSDHDFDATY